MTVDGPDNFDYLPASDNVSEASRKHYWAVAIGLQDVDGLPVSRYLHGVSSDYIAGKIRLEEAGELIRSYHRDGNDIDCTEGDLVSVRIAELLERGAFALDPEILVSIHRYLFQDLDETVYRPGEFKTERMVKQEEILNGDSVLYADPITYEMSLRAAFSAEQVKSYGAFDSDDLAGFCHTIAFLWQIHPFYEGNTRSVAVFSELYLNYLGFSVANEPFEKHSRYYRDALVRAIYRNAPAKIFPDESFLVGFYENVLGVGSNELRREDLVCPELFDDPSLLRNVDPGSALSNKN